MTVIVIIIIITITIAWRHLLCTVPVYDRNRSDRNSDSNFAGENERRISVHHWVRGCGLCSALQLYMCCIPSSCVYDSVTLMREYIVSKSDVIFRTTVNRLGNPTFDHQFCAQYLAYQSRRCKIDSERMNIKKKRNGSWQSRSK